MSPTMIQSALVGLLGVVCYQYQTVFLLVGLLASSILGILIALIAFVNFYIGEDLRKCSPLNEHLAYVNEETQSSQCIKDLDKVANSKGLSKMWKDEIQDQNITCKVLLTGVTGYVGRAFLFQLLREIAQAERSGDGKNLQHKVYVMTRPKARKNLSAAQRLEQMRNDPMFTAVRDYWDKVVVAVESGDLQEDKCGMNQETLQMLADAKLTHVVHCAADVNFNRPLADSAGINISPALKLQALALTWPTCTRFIHCSTAFVNPGCGTPDAPMQEALFPLGKYDPQELYDSMQGDQKLALEAKAELEFPNNYVFTKCIAEHLVVRYNNTSTELKIVRPAIVGPAWVLPEPGWNGDKPSTITALFLLMGTRVLRFAPLNTKPTAMVPVDVVAVGILDAMIAPSQSSPSSSKESDMLTIRNITWSHKSPNKFIDGISIAKRSIPVAVFKHHFTATEAAVSFALIDLSSRYPFLFHPLHRIFNLGPLKLLQFFCWGAKVLGIRSILDQLPVTKLLNFSEMLTLYRPYLSRPYFFESAFNVPSSLSMNQYCISLFTATHAFWTKLFPGTVAELQEMELMPRGRYDLWWALTLPCGSFTNRLIGYLACKIIRATYGSAEVNFVTLFHAGRTLLRLETTMAKQKHCVVLTPTHRSLMDYVLAKYIAFSMVGLGIDVPTVYAENEFENPKLSERIGSDKSKFDRHATLAAFLEGSPSRDGRLQKPSMQFLKALLESPGDHDYTLIPLCIDYDRVDNDNAVMKEAAQNHSDFCLLDMIKLYWQIRASGKLQQCFGDVRISFGVPVSLERNCDLDDVALHVQNEHRRLTTVSEYQLAAAEEHLKIPAATLRTAMKQLAVEVCSNKTKSEKLDPKVPSANDLWRLHMQWIPRLSPFIYETHPKWAKWIMSTAEIQVTEVPNKTSEIDEVITTLCARFDEADALAQRAKKVLHDEGTEASLESLTKEMHTLIVKDTNGNAPIFPAAALFVFAEND